MGQSIYYEYLEYRLWNDSNVDSISDVKSEINRVLEKLKKEGVIKSGLEIDVSVVSGRSSWTL